MKLATFTHAGQTRIGLVDDSAIVDLAAAVPALPQEMCAFLRAGQPALDAARHALSHRAARLRLSDVWLEAPVQRPGKLITIGVNYKEHAAEAGRETPPPTEPKVGVDIAGRPSLFRLIPGGVIEGMPFCPCTACVGCPASPRRVLANVGSTYCRRFAKAFRSTGIRDGLSLRRFEGTPFGVGLFAPRSAERS